jgi:hypothetical protein
VNRLVPNIALLLFSLGLTLGVAEIGLRLLAPRNGDDMAHARVPDPLLGWKAEPGARYTHRIGGTAFPVEYNARGWRDVDHEFAKPPGTTRIVVLGDSFMEAYSVPLEDSFPRALGRAAAEAGHDAEVINISAGGFGTLQQYVAFREEAARYAPDLVLVGFYVANDVRNNSRELETRMWEGTNIKVASRPFLRATPDRFEISQVDYEGALARYQQGRARVEGGWVGFLRRNSALFSFVWKRVRAARANIGGLAVDAGNAAPDYYRTLLGVDLCEEPPEYTRAWELTARILRQLRSDTEAAGARLVVFSVPALAQVDPVDQRGLVEKTGEPDAFCLEQAPGHRRLAEMCQAEGIAFIELLPAFRKALRDGNQTLFHAEDRHWNRAAHALATREVARELESRGLLPR